MGWTYELITYTGERFLVTCRHAELFDACCELYVAGSVTDINDKRHDLTDIQSIKRMVQ